jgi:hypothetical protein
MEQEVEISRQRAVLQFVVDAVLSSVTRKTLCVKGTVIKSP